MKKQITVSGAIIIKNGLILCAQRNVNKHDYISYKFEFPGGKIEEHETPKEALHRELIEEMNVDININDMTDFIVVNHEYPDFNLTMHTFLCPIKSDETLTLKEHVSMKRSKVEDLDKIDWAGADIPVAKALKERGI